MRKKRNFLKNRARAIPDLESVIKSFISENHLESVMDFVKISKNWSQLVGERLAPFCEPKEIKNKILYIKTKSSVWRNEVFFLRSDIVIRINDFFGKLMVVKIMII